MTLMNIVSAASEGNGAPLTMSSREIAELLGEDTRHDNVKRTIETLEKRGAISRPQFEDRYFTDAQGKPRTEKVYLVGKRDSYVIVAQLSPEFTAKLVDRWQELEQGLAQPRLVVDPSDPKVMLAVFDHLQKQVAEKDAVIAAQVEKVKQLDRLAGAEGSMCISDAAKTLGLRRNDLIVFLQQKKWIFKRPGNKNWLAYDAVRPRYMEHDDHPYVDSEGRDRVSTRALVTAAGLVKIAALLNATMQ